MSDPAGEAMRGTGTSGISPAQAGTQQTESGRGRGDETSSLPRVLGPIDASCVVIGAIIGVGIFFTPTRVAALSGSASLALMAWMIGGGIALLGALTFAELGTLYPNTGGQYEILRDAYGPLPGFLFVFCNATYVQAGAIAIIALVCAQNIGVAVSIDGLAPGKTVQVVLSCVIVLSLMAANGMGVRWGAGIQNLTVYAKVATLLAVTALAAAMGTHGIQPAAVAAGAENLLSQPGARDKVASGSGFAVVGTLFAAMVPAFFSYGGWQHALWIAGEVRRPQRNLPLAIIGGTLVVIAVYVSANWAFLHLLGYAGVCESKALAADAVATVWPTYGKRAIAAAVAVSAFGVLNAQLLSGPRLLFRMAGDGRFFSPFARISPKFGTPLPAIILLGAIALVLLLAAHLDEAITWFMRAVLSREREAHSPMDALNTLLTGVVFVDGIFFVLTGFALFVLRSVKPQLNFAKSFGYPFVPLLFVLGEIGVVAGSCGDPSVIVGSYVGASWILAAALIYLAFFRKRSTVNTGAV